MIVARACGTDLKSFADEYLLGPLGVVVGDWLQDADGYYTGHGEIHPTARDAARFGLLYVSDGEFQGSQIIPFQWVRDSLETYSEDAWDYWVGRSFRDVGYGYLWWSARAGRHRFNLAWGHGGQVIAVVPQFDMVIVAIGDPFYLEQNEEAWDHEKARLNLVADYIASLPADGADSTCRTRLSFRRNRVTRAGAGSVQCATHRENQT